jgi:hypothetical protein
MKPTKKELLDAYAALREAGVDVSGAMTADNLTFNPVANPARGAARAQLDRLKADPQWLQRLKAGTLRLPPNTSGLLRTWWDEARLRAHEPGIITCSNLKRAYRQITIGSRQGVRLVFLKNDEHVIHARILQRQHRYMPSSLLRSQFETLEEPGEDEHPVVVTV